MAAIKPYASLNNYGKSAIEYYIRLNSAAAKLLKDLQYVRIGKTADNRYIVLTPVDKAQADEMCRKVTLKGKDKTAGYIFVTAWVTNRFFDGSWFGGARYKLKRDRSGRIYICLTERIVE